jgi:hypothetical protein
LAKAENTPVLFTVVDIPVEVAAPIKSADEPVVVQLKQAPVMATGDEVQVADVVSPPAVQVEVAENTLPKTPSPISRL